MPALFTALKAEVHRSRDPGRFLLTGSANVLLVPRLADSLAGRMEILRLHPLSQAELGRQASPFFRTLLSGGFKTRRTRRLKDELAERIVAGGYPAVLARPAGRHRTTWYRDYVDANCRLQRTAKVEGGSRTRLRRRGRPLRRRDHRQSW